MDLELTYSGQSFSDVNITLKNYKKSYFEIELKLESDLFFDLRKNNNIKPYTIIDSSPDGLEEIRTFFDNNRETFYFLFDQEEFVGSILYIGNYIQSLCISKEYQGKGFGKKLVKFVTNKILDSGHKEVVLNVLAGNEIAKNLYLSLGYKIIKKCIF